MDFNLLLLLCSSPLPPKATLRFLEKRGLKFKLDGEMRKLIEEAERSGSVESLRKVLEDKLNDQKTEVEVIDKSLEQVYNLVTTLLIVVPLTIVSTLILTGSGGVLEFIFAISLSGGVIGTIVALSLLPGILKDPNPPYISFIPLMTLIFYNSIPVYLLLLSTGIAAFLQILYLGNWIRQEKRIFYILRKGLNYSFNLRLFLKEEGIKIEDLLKWRKPFDYAFKTLYLFLLFSVNVEDYRRLLEYSSIMYYLKKSIRQKIVSSFLFTIISAGILGLGLGLINNFTSLHNYPSTVLTFSKPSYEEFVLGLILIALGLSFTSSSIVHINPLYFPLHLFPIILTEILGFQLSTLFMDLLI